MIENNRYYWSKLKTKTVTVSVSPRGETTGVVFRVSKMIDLGRGRQTAVLEHVELPQVPYRRPGKEGVSIPLRMGNLDFIYTSRQNPMVQSVSELLSWAYAGEKIERIVSDVLCPGDLLVFRQQEKSMKINMIEALRIVKQADYKESKAGYAV